MKENQILPASGAVRAPCEQTSPPRRILVVDDEADIRRLNTQALLASGYEVESAVDGAAAWQALNLDSYDLMITDNNMPKLTGLELLQKLRAARMTLPVIIASGTFFPQVSGPSPWLQPDATLLKPYTIAELVTTVQKILGAANDSSAEPTKYAVRELKASETPPAIGPAPARPRSAHRILVVDEDRDLREMYAEILAGADYEVDKVADGVAGWEALQANQYKLLITEHDLPKLSGVELVGKLRAAHMALPVVMVAARLPANELAQDSSLQLAAVLMKPFAVDALLNTVQQVLRPPLSAVA